MGFRRDVRAQNIRTAAEDRMKTGHKIFAHRLQIPSESRDNMSVLADAIEDVEVLGWALDRMEPDPFVGESAIGTNASWLLVFRSRI
ncbi:hypothetical protein [Streptomyces sp. NPDC059256]|uniref:hypothetical protein n=1 Tax=Streptomyces sp. NPDC059256 TaxID=3346794 RepID=UPI0036B342D4